MMTELTQEQRSNVAELALEATMTGLDLMVVTGDRNRLLAALKVLEHDHIVIHPEYGKSCEWCGGETGHMDDCPFAVIALVEDTDRDLPEPLDDGPSLHAEFAQYQMGQRVRALLAPVPELLKRAAEHCEWAYASGTDAMQAERDANALRELARTLREAGVGVEEEEG